MDTVAFEYGFLGIIILMIFFAFLIGTNKMLQVIIATTCIALVTLGWSGFLTFLSYNITTQNTLIIFGFGPTDIVSLLQNGEMTTNLLIYVGLLVYAIQYTTPSVVMSSNILNSKLLQLLLSPLAIFSMIVSLTIAIFGINIFSLSFLSSMGTKFGTQSFVYQYMQYIPLGVLIQGLITLLLVFQSNKKSDISYDDI